MPQARPQRIAGGISAIPSTRGLIVLAAVFLAAGGFAPAEGPKDTGDVSAKVPETFFAGRLSALEEKLFADSGDGQLDEHSLLEAALIASGAEDTKTVSRYESQLDALAAEFRKSSDKTADPRRRAIAVFEFMHARVLRGNYRIECTDLREALSQGDFNCVSASVLYNCLAERMGLTVRGLEIPGHAMSRVVLDKGPLEVETTCPSWFRLMGDPRKQAEMVKKTLGRDPAKARATAREVSPVEMVAMIYYNRGVDLLADKQFEQAAVANAKALWLDPSSTTARGNLLATINNWAIAAGSKHQFAEAVDLLHRGLALDPKYPTFTPNYVHIHHQWMEHLCGAGEFEEALEVLCRAETKLPDRPYFHRASMDVYRRWARSLFEQGKPDAAFALFTRAKSRHGTVPEVLAAEAGAVNDQGLALLKRGQAEEALAVFDRGLAVQPNAKLLRTNRRKAAEQRATSDPARGSARSAGPDVVGNGG
ncbi:MAG: hypothetical protein HQ567_32300 [Candidatus Nealsonbacteria bacterium]|nr:hypothetical protein [Candidatus Nealsonbacteria bacterium]